MNKFDFRSKESLFFFFIAVVNTFPVLSLHFFPTLDGPAHLYNATLIDQLLFKNNEVLQGFFNFNNEAIPNWTGHFLLAFFHLFLPGYLAEKAMLLVYLIGLPWSFRYLIKTLSPGNYLLCYIIFPFTYSFVLYLGFYNFCLALVLLFISIAYWIKHENNLALKNCFFLFALITLTYFSHLYVYLFLIFGIALHISISAVIQSGKHTLRSVFSKLLKLFIVSAVSIVLAVFYFTSRTAPDNSVYLSKWELLKWIENIRPIVVFSFGREQLFTRIIFYMILILFFYSIYKRIKEKRTYPADAWAVMTVITLSLYLFIYDSDGVAGYISVRTGFVFFLFLISWLCCQNFPQKLIMGIVSIVLICHFILLVRHYNVSKELNDTAVECNNASEYIEPSAVVLPLNFSGNWLHSHFSNYLGVDKPMVLLENYECRLDWFPLEWKHEQIDHTIRGNGDAIQLLTELTSPEGPKPKIDYVFSLEDKTVLNNDSTMKKLMLRMDSTYRVIYKASAVKLYKIKDRI
jgi:hypothetical protein